MKRMIWISIIITGAIFSVFVLNLLLYSFVPSYRMALLSAVGGRRSDIPVIEVVEEKDDSNVFSVEEKPEITAISDEKTALSPFLEENQENISGNKPQIIERTYYEDCGTGHGYWVLKYSDGTFGIE